MPRKPIRFQSKPKIIGSAASVGGLEGKGPLKTYFDLCSSDSKFGMDTWEKAEAEMVRSCIETAIKKAKLSPADIDLAFSGDLTNQCAASFFGIKDEEIPHIGLYGACSTFALSVGMAALSIEAGLSKISLGSASSHYCTAERQYRFPLEYGCQRTPTAQTTVTGAGCVILKESSENLPYISEFFPGIIRDYGITDANNMGAAMAPACADTLVRYFDQSDEKPENFDLIATGDLGYEGHRLLSKLCAENGLFLGNQCTDCGMIVYDANEQEVHAGGSGCGCSATVFSSFIVEQLKNGIYKDVLLIGTGALLNPNTVLQKENIPGVAHLIRIRKDG